MILSWLPSCGECFYCVQGRGVLCDVAMADMFEGTLPGGTLALSQNGTSLYHYSYLSTFAERCVVPESCCVKVRKDASLEIAALVGCAVMTGFGAAVLRARVEPGSTAVVYGAGGVGLSAILGCRLAGARAIVAADPVAFKRETALGWARRTPRIRRARTSVGSSASSPTGAARTTPSTRRAPRASSRRRTTPSGAAARSSRSGFPGRRDRGPLGRGSHGRRRSSRAASTARAARTSTCRS